MTTLYNKILLEHARNPRNQGLPEGRTIEARWANPLCGDTVIVGATVAHGRFVDIGFEADACAVCVAAASMMAEELRGTMVDQMHEPQQELERVLAGDRATMQSPFAPFRSISKFPSRRACVLLPWRAMELAVIGGERAQSLPECAPLDTSELSPWIVARNVLERGELAAIATLVAVDGSSPCPVGSRMVVSSTGNFWGSVSGGCVESAVVQAAMATLGLSSEHRPSQLLDYQISNSQAGEVGLPCGGRIQVHVSASPSLPELETRLAAEGPSICVTDLQTGESRVVAPEGELGEYPAEVRDEARQLVQNGAPVLVTAPTGQFFVELLGMPWRLVLIGGTHIAQKLARLAAEVGLHPIVVDPRESLANPSRFPGIDVLNERPSGCLSSLIQGSTAVVALTHDQALDDPALEIALKSEAYYVAALGSRKTQRARLERLRESGLSAEQLARLHGPAGLAIGARGAGEIALSILAEVVATRRLVDTPARRVAAVVLAAGSSRRAGPDNKLLRDFEGTPMVRRVVETACAAGLSPCIVVLGHDADALREALRDLPVQFVENHDHLDGMGGSVAVGVEVVAEDDVDACLILLGDMPLVSVDDLERLVAAHQTSTQHLIVAPEAGSAGERRLGNPVLWPRRYFAELIQLRGEGGGKSILLRAPGAVLRVPIDHDGVLRDFDR